MTESSAPAAPAASARPRRERTLTETLLSITLGLEAAMMFFATVVVFGLDRFDPDWLAFVYGAVFILVLALVAGVQRWAWGVWTGAALQFAILATGFVEPMMFLAGGAFVALWVYCFVRGRQIDRQKAQWLAERAAAETTEATEQGDAP